MYSKEWSLQQCESVVLYCVSSIVDDPDGTGCIIFYKLVASVSLFGI